MTSTHPMLTRKKAIDMAMLDYYYEKRISNPKPIVPKPIVPKPIVPKAIVPKPIVPKPIVPKPIVPKLLYTINVVEKYKLVLPPLHKIRNEEDDIIDIIPESLEF